MHKRHQVDQECYQKCCKRCCSCHGGCLGIPEKGHADGAGCMGLCKWHFATQEGYMGLHKRLYVGQGECKGEGCMQIGEDVRGCMRMQGRCGKGQRGCVSGQHSASTRWGEL